MAIPEQAAAIERPLDMTEEAAQAVQPFEPIGAPGTAIFGGFVYEAEKDSALVGQAKYLTYSDILANTAIVGAGVRFFLNVVAKAAWKVQPADDSEEAKKLAELVDDIIRNMNTPWHRVVRRAAMYRFYGFGIQEWTAVRRDDGVVGLLDVEPRAQSTIERWDRDPETGQILGVIQRNVQNGQDIYLPREKIVHLCDDSLNDSPEGLGLFRHLVNAARRLHKYELLEAWGFETDLRGIPVARAPLARLQQLVSEKKLTPQQAADLRSPLETFIDKHSKNPALGMLLDSAVYRSEGESKAPGNTYMWNAELMQGDGGPHAEVASAIERLNRELARVLGVEHMLLGSDSKGSHALSVDKTQSFGIIVDSVLIEMREQFKKDLLGPLWKLNGWDPKLMPSFKTDTMQHRDITLLTTALESLAKAGAPLQPNDPAVNEIRSLAGLTDAPEVDLATLTAMMSVQPGKLEGMQPLAPGLDPATGKPIEPEAEEKPAEAKEE